MCSAFSKVTVNAKLSKLDLTSLFVQELSLTHDSASIVSISVT